MRFSRLVLSLALIGLLAACGSVPRPFSPDAKPGGLAIPGPEAALVVHPLAGTEGTPLDALTETIIVALQTSGVAAIPYETPNRYRLLGQADAIALEGDQAVMALHIQLTRPDLTPVDEIRWEVRVPWGRYVAGDKAVVDTLAVEMAGQIRALIGIPEPTAVAANVDLSVSPVVSAPGDGRESLPRAMISALKRLGIEAVSGPPQATLPSLEVAVSVQPISGGRDRVQLVWRLRDSTGKERGRLEQQNAVPTGRLSRAWGEIAGLAALAAAPEVADLLQRLRESGS